MILDWLQSELINSVPRIGRRSFSPISKFRGEGFRFYGGDLPRGIVPSYAYNDENRNSDSNSNSRKAKNWSATYGRNIGGESRDGNEVDVDDVTSGKSRDKRDPEIPAKRVDADGIPSLPIPRMLNLGDEDYWNEFLIGARKTVMDKLVILKKTFQQASSCQYNKPRLA